MAHAAGFQIDLLLCSSVLLIGSYRAAAIAQSQSILETSTLGKTVTNFLLADVKSAHVVEVPTPKTCCPCAVVEPIPTAIKVMLDDGSVTLKFSPGNAARAVVSALI